MKKILSNRYFIIFILALLINAGFITISGNNISAIENQSIKSTLSPGDHFRFIISDNNIRSYRIHIPPSYNYQNPMPLVFVLHGSGVSSNSYSTKISSEMDKKADEEGFIAVYPNGELLRFSQYYKHPITFLWDLYSLAYFSREWNRWNENNIDDVGFIRNLINHLETLLNVNSSRIYITGISGGAMMTYRLGAELSNYIAAIAPIAGVIGGIAYVPEPDDSISPYIISKPINPIPVIAFNGLQDKSVPYEGGWKHIFEWKSDDLWVYTVSVNESITFWVENNYCDSNPHISKSENERIITTRYKSNDGNSDVVLVTYLDGGHEWFKSPPHELSAIDIMWDFFEQNPK
jgi:polyhydroxybutyrate depolymerase